VGIEEYKGHVLVLIEASQTERIGTIAQNILWQCYPHGSAVPAPDTLHYTLGKLPRHLVWNQGRAPEQILDMEERVGREIVLSDTDKLEVIEEDATIFIFLPPPDMDRAISRKPSADQANRLETPLSGHQIFVQVPDTWSETGRKSAYIQTLPIPTSLDTLKEGLSQLLSIPTHAFRIQYGRNTY